MYRVQPQLPTWEVLAEDLQTRSVPVSGSKRSYDYTVDEFFADVKKRRVAPAYDPRECLDAYATLSFLKDLEPRYGSAAEQSRLPAVAEFSHERWTTSEFDATGSLFPTSLCLIRHPYPRRAGRSQ